ncbi:type I toxin-antitoxin system SymE family toxin [Serratia fonticola]|uniref:type I toxin-antitoxin system SymE family toxin n=1 Tax=Serratia fonticola TaxID=47917 RepID=UPI00211C3080|nr:type I toxin-antitoxin system SymE family toxin [Serratia fonticola]
MLLHRRAQPGVDRLRWAGINADSGELYLAGDWLTQCGLTGQPLAISVMPGKVVIKVQQGNILV